MNGDRPTRTRSGLHRRLLGGGGTRVHLVRRPTYTCRPLDIGPSTLRPVGSGIGFRPAIADARVAARTGSGLGVCPGVRLGTGFRHGCAIRSDSGLGPDHGLWGIELGGSIDLIRRFRFGRGCRCCIAPVQTVSGPRESGRLGWRLDFRTWWLSSAFSTLTRSWRLDDRY